MPPKRTVKYASAMLLFVINGCENVVITEAPSFIEWESLMDYEIINNQIKINEGSNLEANINQKTKIKGYCRKIADDRSI